MESCPPCQATRRLPAWHRQAAGHLQKHGQEVHRVDCAAYKPDSQTDHPISNSEPHQRTFSLSTQADIFPGQRQRYEIKQEAGQLETGDQGEQEPGRLNHHRLYRSKPHRRRRHDHHDGAGGDSRAEGVLSEGHSPYLKDYSDPGDALHTRSGNTSFDQPCRRP